MKSDAEKHERITRKAKMTRKNCDGGETCWNTPAAEQEGIMPLAEHSRAHLAEPGNVQKLIDSFSEFANFLLHCLKKDKSHLACGSQLQILSNAKNYLAQKFCNDDDRLGIPSFLDETHSAHQAWHPDLRVSFIAGFVDVSVFVLPLFNVSFAVPSRMPLTRAAEPRPSDAVKASRKRRQAFVAFCSSASARRC